MENFIIQYFTFIILASHLRIHKVILITEITGLQSRSFSKNQAIIIDHVLDLNTLPRFGVIDVSFFT